MTSQNEKLSQVEAEIETCKPYAKKCQELGIDINRKDLGVRQGYADRARRFCELVVLRNELEG